MKDQDSNDSIRMSRRDLLWMGTAGIVGGSLLARTPTALGQASAATRLKKRGRLRATTARTPIPFPRGRAGN